MLVCQVVVLKGLATHLYVIVQGALLLLVLADELLVDVLEQVDVELGVAQGQHGVVGGDLSLLLQADLVEDVLDLAGGDLVLVVEGQRLHVRLLEDLSELLLLLLVLLLEGEEALVHVRVFGLLRLLLLTAHQERVL